LRKGCCPGRRMLRLHQLLLLAVFIFGFTQYEWLNKREMSIRVVIADPTTSYDSFEERIATILNPAYYESICSDDQSTAWILNFVDEHCPASMRQKNCALSGKKRSSCDTSCNESALKCCPSQVLCNEGNEAACPYFRCRVPVLEELFVWVG
jgi:hypothetical protein